MDRLIVSMEMAPLQETGARRRGVCARACLAGTMLHCCCSSMHAPFRLQEGSASAGQMLVEGKRRPDFFERRRCSDAAAFSAPGGFLVQDGLSCLPNLLFFIRMEGRWPSHDKALHGNGDRSSGQTGFDFQELPCERGCAPASVFSFFSLRQTRVIMRVSGCRIGDQYRRARHPARSTADSYKKSPRKLSDRLASAVMARPAGEHVVRRQGFRREDEVRSDGAPE
ncbi:hypothetical protein B0T11DRAFT_127435 [Plectosphaerella cucumerina]|uniref:Uncharacterized protein n=1 Tax=Plectosphaerella cucumerina TaxID=40658 RepID=A0A8K0X292_9PEZI|nr:hypothetical protein B0T11DRAFT_127435 [Plectosphaerella cucumerina]